MKWDDVRWFSAYLALMTIMIPFATLPPQLSAALGERVGILIYHILSKWRRNGIKTVSSLMPYLTEKSSSLAASTPEEIIREVFKNSGIFISELSRLYFGSSKALVEGVEFRGMENYEAAHSKGRGIICITAHCGNWELMALAFGARVAPVAVVARNMKRGYFDTVLEKIRLQYGNRVIYRDSGVKEMLLLLKGNGSLGILPDQVVKPPHGILADFFGQPCWTTVMPAKLSIKTGSPMIPFFIHREDGKNIITIHPEIEICADGSEDERILDGTTKMNLAIEKHILQYPTQWNWLYSRWKGVPKK